MLGPIRKFSTSIYAKVLLVIVIIPFVFWGMGNTFFGGNKNIVLTIDKEKYSIQEFYEFINMTAQEKVKISHIEKFLKAFISEKLIEKEIENYGILLSDESLSKLIKHQKEFKRDGKFSRVEYEKFLLENNVTTLTFESMIRTEEKKKQLFNFISGGAIPTNFQVNDSYDKINQKRNIQLINLNSVFKKNLNFSEDQIEKYYIENKNKYSEIYKTIKMLELDPNTLVDSDEFSDLYFKKIDEIDDLIIINENFESILSKFNLPPPNLATINILGLDVNMNESKKISKEISKKIFDLDENEKITLLEIKNKYYVVEIVETKDIVKDLSDQSVYDKILLDLKNQTKRKLAIEVIDKINKGAFSKLDFDNLSKDELVEIQNIKINSQNDDKILKKEVIKQIYQYPEKRIILVSDLSFSKIYLVYVEKIENVIIDENSDEFQNYLKLSQRKIVSDLYNTYDSYVKNKYDININYQALDVVKNYFN